MVSLDIVENINLDDKTSDASMTGGLHESKSADETGKSNAAVSNDTKEIKVSYDF